MSLRFGIPLLVVSAFALAACGGSRGSGGFAPVALPQSATTIAAPQTATVAIAYTIKIPARTVDATPEQRHERFVSASTQSIEFIVYAAGKPHTAKNLLLKKAVALNAGAKGCTGKAARTCKGVLNLPPPSVDIVATTYDLKPVGQKIPPNAKALGYDAIAGQAVKAGKSIKLVLGGIPASITLSIPGSTVVAGVPTLSIHGVAQSSTTIDVQALDADGNVILTDGYVNAAGKSTGISIATKPSQASCTSPVFQNGSSTPGASILVSAPAPGGVAFLYGSPAIAAPFTTPGYCSFSITARLAKGPVQSGSILLTGPMLAEYTVPTNGAPSSPRAITTGPDGNIWFADNNGSVGTVNVSTKAITTYSVGSAPNGIVSSGGSLWVSAPSQFYQISTSGTATSFANAGTSPGEEMAVASNGTFWFAQTQQQTLANVTTAGVATFTPTLTQNPKPYPVGAAAGPDGNLWFTECVGNKVERISPQGTHAQEFAIPNTPNGQPLPFMIATGPDNNLWFTSCGGGTISRMPVPTGKPNVTVFALTLPSGQRTQLWGLTGGSDNAMWFGDFGNHSIDRIPTDATSVAQVTRIPVSSNPRWVTTGPDGAMWFTECTQGSGNGKIGRIVP